jgi:hypothetical protein
MLFPCFLLEGVPLTILVYPFCLISQTAYSSNQFYHIGYVFLLTTFVLSCSMMFCDDTSLSTYTCCHVLVSLLLICAI